MAQVSHLMTYKVFFGRHQLAVSFNRKRGRPKKPFIKSISNYISRLAKIGTNRRLGGHPTSRVLRRLFESRKTRQIFGVNLMAAIILTGTIVPPISAFTDNPEAEITAITPSVAQLTTEETIRVPVDSFQITQGYHLFHRAVDLKEIPGAPVYPIMDGVMEQVVYGRFSYGNYVVVNHGSGFKSLYAHLAKIIAAEGEEVDQNTVLGTVGTTGWATGSHLHLEVYDHGHPFNPLTILPAK